MISLSVARKAVRGFWRASARKVGLARASPPTSPTAVDHSPQSKFEQHRPSQSWGHLLDAGSPLLISSSPVSSSRSFNCLSKSPVLGRLIHTNRESNQFRRLKRKQSTQCF